MHIKASAQIVVVPPCVCLAKQEEWETGQCICSETRGCTDLRGVWDRELERVELSTFELPLVVRPQLVVP